MQSQTATLNRTLQRWLTGAVPTPLEQQQLATWLLADQQRAQAFGVTVSNVTQHIQQRIDLFFAVYSAFQNSQTTFKIPADPWVMLWELWLPLAMQLMQQRQSLQRPWIQGILGGQGTGKTTLAAVLTLILQQLGYQTLSLSLDDLYKTYGDRQQLQASDPRLIWRGPPGTHDVELGLCVLDQLRQFAPTQPIQIPRFDKSLHQGAGDRTQPEIVEIVDIVLFEGWFVGVRPLAADQLAAPLPAPILTEADRVFARDMNTLLQAYLPLWQRLDALWVLYVPDYRLSKQWRRQAEHAMIASGKPGMNDREIDAFVEYFWRALHPDLFIRPLVHDPALANLVIEVQPDHLPGQVYKPESLSTRE